MSMETAWQGRLLAAPAVSAIVAQRIYWVERPQRSGLPAITLQIVTDERAQSYAGLDGLQAGYVQADGWATSYAEAKALKEAMIATLLPAATAGGVRFTRAFVTARDLSERTETQFLFRPSLDFTFHYSPA